MTTSANAALTTNAGRILRPLGVFGSAAYALRQWYRCHRDMRHLMELDDYLLRDVGITRDEVARAAGTPWNRS